MTPRYQKGFTLIEIAIVIVIIGIITAGLLSGMGAIRESAKFKEDQRNLQDIKSALLGFVAVNGYLPCPDTSGDGFENIGPTGSHDRNATGADLRCHQTFGLLPYLDLDTHAKNAYGYPFSYYINTNANNNSNMNGSNDNSANYFGNCSANSGNRCFTAKTRPIASDATSDLGNYRVSDGTASLANQVPLVVVSHGKDLKNLTTCNGKGSFENWNCDRTQRTLTPDNQVLLYQAPQSETFDDVLIWLSGLEIKRAAGLFEITSIPYDTPPPPPPNQDPLIPVNQAPSSEFVDFDQIVYGNYNSDSQLTTTNQSDKIKIEGDMNQALDLRNGEDMLYVEGNLNARLDGGNQDKTIFIDGDVNSPIDLGQGNNTIEVTGSVNAMIQTGNGANNIIIHGTVNSAITLATGGQDSAVYLGSNINATVSGRGTVYINQTPSQLENWQYNHIQTFNTILCRQEPGSTNWVSCR
ncbi:prepilin-type N-terminal cleavage/methylation domain-containing protein [Thiomicrospira microaerophila]|uniref:prepilin-type N-terminal cleavage/methylation domain-containing protein n=1 Tax=Thiomicrospira microaerophila TaxID=406020 RepID=UPI000698FAB1|nr:prepilin-type N-terminal cleavage/methylation domain-containing protein [Thiomicrospira microaerophila]